MVTPQFSVVVESFLTFLATIFLCIIVHYFNMLVEVGVFFVTERANVLLAASRDSVYSLLVCSQDGLLVEDFAAQVTCVETLGLLPVLLSVFSFNVLIQIGELNIAKRASLPKSQVYNSLVSSQVILLGEGLHTYIADKL